MIIFSFIYNRCAISIILLILCLLWNIFNLTDPNKRSLLMHLPVRYCCSLYIFGNKRKQA